METNQCHLSLIERYWCHPEEAGQTVLTTNNLPESWTFGEKWLHSIDLSSDAARADHFHRHRHGDSRAAAGLAIHREPASQ